MTREAFIKRAVKTAERSLRIPDGWWGKWRDVTDGTVRVKFTTSARWRVSLDGIEISRHDVRSRAIRKAHQLSTDVRSNR